jgi:hypothetical protein
MGERLKKSSKKRARRSGADPPQQFFSPEFSSSKNKTNQRPVG